MRVVQVWFQNQRAKVGFTFLLKTCSMSHINTNGKFITTPCDFVSQMKKIARRQQQQQQQQQEQEQLGGTRRGQSRGGRQSNDDSEGTSFKFQCSINKQRKINDKRADIKKYTYCMTKGIFIFSQMDPVLMAWMEYWDIHLCHVSNYLHWTPTSMVESPFDMGLLRLS